MSTSCLSSSSLGSFCSSSVHADTTSSLSCSSTSSSSQASATSLQAFSKRSGNPTKTEQNASRRIVGLLTAGKADELPSVFMSFLATKDLAHLSQICVAANDVGREYLRTDLLTKIQKAKEALQEIVAFEPIDETRLNNGAYCAETWTRMVRKIKADPVIQEIFEANKEDFEKTAQAIKDRDLLICCREGLRQNFVQGIEGNDSSSLSSQAARARSWLEAANSHILSWDPHQSFDLKSLQLRTVPMEFILKFHGFTNLDLARNQIQVIPDSIKKLTQLQYLRLDSNRIQAIPASLEKLPELLYLLLCENLIQVIPSFLGRLPRIKRLYFSENPIRMISEEVLWLPLEVFGGLTKSLVLRTRGGFRNYLHSYTNTVLEYLKKI